MLFRVLAVSPSFPGNLLSSLLPRSLLLLMFVIFRKEKGVMLTGEYTLIHKFEENVQLICHLCSCPFFIIHISIPNTQTV